MNPSLPLFLVDWFTCSSVFGTLECDPLTSCLFAGRRNWAQELIIAIPSPEICHRPWWCGMFTRAACDNKFGSCADGSLHLEPGAWSKFWLILGRWHTCSPTERGKLGEQARRVEFAQNWSCRGATESYSLDHIFRNYLLPQLSTHIFCKLEIWRRFAMLVNCAIKGGHQPQESNCFDQIPTLYQIIFGQSSSAYHLLCS